MRNKNLYDLHKSFGDICVSAPTGSGKTLAYVLTIIEVCLYYYYWTIIELPINCWIIIELLINIQ